MLKLFFLQSLVSSVIFCSRVFLLVNICFVELLLFFHFYFLPCSLQLVTGFHAFVLFTSVSYLWNLCLGLLEYISTRLDDFFRVFI